MLKLKQINCEWCDDGRVSFYCKLEEIYFCSDECAFEYMDKDEVEDLGDTYEEQCRERNK